MAALPPEALTELRKETTEKVEQGFATIIWYGDIKGALTDQLKIPHCNDSAQTAPKRSVKNLGRVLQRLVGIMATAPTCLLSLFEARHK